MKDPEVHHLLELQRADPIQHWLLQAEKRAAELRLPIGFLTEAAGIVSTALTPELIKREAGVARPGFLKTYHGHPLVRRLLTADEAAIAHVIELAVYLKRLARVPGINGALPGLRDEDSYRSTLLQLAYCYRFVKAGAAVELEPASAAGLGDIRIRSAGRDYQVECLARSDPPDPYKEFIAYSPDRLFDRCKSLNKHLRVRVRFLRPPTTEDRLELERVAGELIERVSRETVEAETSSAIIAVDPMEGTQERDFLPSGDRDPSGPYADSSGLFARSTADLGTVLTAAHTLRPREKGSRIFWWSAPGAEKGGDQALLRLLERMEKKLAQTHDPSKSAGRILVAQVLEGDAQILHRHEFLAAIHDKLFPRHERLASVIVTARVWRADNRYRYVGGLVAGLPRDPVADLIEKTLNRIDHEFDVLHDAGP